MLTVLAGLAKIFSAVYSLSIVSILLYEYMIRTDLVSRILAVGEYSRLVGLLIVSLVPSLVLSLILRSVSREPLEKIERVYGEVKKMSNMIDAYAVVLRRYEEDLREVRGYIDELRSRENSLGVRVSALEKLLPVILETQTREKERA